MYICVCVKQTPDSSSVYIDPISGQVDVERFVQVLNPADACAVEAAVRLKEQLGGTVLALTLGPSDAEGALRAALAIGADSAVRLWNSQANGWESFAIATALAAGITQEAQVPDLILCGDSASDWSSSTVGPALAETLGLPQVTGVMQLTVRQEQAETQDQDQDSNSVTLQVTRRLERGYRELIEAQPPLLVSVTRDLNEPRYPSLPAHLAALRAKIPVFDPQTLLGQRDRGAIDPALGTQSLLDQRGAIDPAPTAFGTQFIAPEETVLLEMHMPRPRPRRLATPDSQHSAFERIGEIVTGGAIGRKTRLIEGTPQELAQVLVQFLRDKDFLE